MISRGKGALGKFLALELGPDCPSDPTGPARQIRPGEEENFRIWHMWTGLKFRQP